MARSTRLIASTPQAAVRLLGTGGTRAISAYAQIRQYLKASLGEDYAALLAEPRLDNANGKIDWFAEVEGEPVPLPALSPERRAAAETLLAERRTKIEQVAEALSAREQTSARLLGELLRQALTVADENSVLADGERLVLVNWGCAGDRAAGPSKAPLTAARATPAAKPLPPPEPAAPPTTPPVAPVLVAARTPAWWWPLVLLLWLIFAGLMAYNYYLLLEACAVSRPGPEDDDNPLLSFCPVDAAAPTAPADLATEQARAAELKDKLRQIELRVAEARRACPDSGKALEEPADKTPEDTETPDETKPPEEIPPPEETKTPDETKTDPDKKPDEFDERVAEGGGKGGEVQVTLIWDGAADLDLIVMCPSGELIYYERRGGCGGGTLDVDANYEKRMPEPVENVRWPDKAPPGNYRVLVRNVDTPEAIPYRVRVTVDGKDTEFSGTAAAAQGTVAAGGFAVP